MFVKVWFMVAVVPDLERRHQYMVDVGQPAVQQVCLLLLVQFVPLLGKQEEAFLGQSV